jgi:flagellin-like protein
MGNGEVERNMMKSRRSTRGLSPIFATLILIAIAVIAGIVVYAFVSGAIPGYTSPSGVSEKAAVQSAAGTGNTVTCYAQYVAGGSQITINGAIVKASDGTDMGPCTVSGGPLGTDGALETITVTTTTSLSAGELYTVTLTSSKGGNFVGPSFPAT